jgi:hypothetical protein
MARNTVYRSMHDLGLAGWFGGTLANAVALNPSAAAADDVRDTGRVANTGWDRWTPVNAAAIGVHLIGSVGLLSANKARLAAQEGVARTSAAKTALTAAAFATTVYSRFLGRKVSQYHDTPAESGTEPARGADRDVAAAQRQLDVLQWAVPALTGVLVFMNAFMGEQQRPSEVRQGVLSRLTA